MLTPEKIKAMLETLRDQGFVCADDDQEMDYLVQLVGHLLEDQQ